MSDTRLIERWLPIAEIGVESTRERTPMTPFPAPNRLHVWWARRPLVASRAAVLASLLPANADREKFLHVLGIHGDPIATRQKIDAARRRGERFEGQAYSYPRAFSYIPREDDHRWLQETLGTNGLSSSSVLDPTAGGGSIPFEAVRLGTRAVANDLNPVSALIMRATVLWPSLYGTALESAYRELSDQFVPAREERLASYFPPEPERNCISTNHLWARTIVCPYCDGLVPLSPNWRLAPDGTGVKLCPDCTNGPGTPGRVCTFEIVQQAEQQSPGTVARGKGQCPWPDCGRIIDGDEIKSQAKARGMGEQLFAVVYKRRIETKTKSGKRGRDKWVRGYRAPRAEDDNSADIDAKLAEKLAEWQALDFAPSERIPDGTKTTEPHRYGMALWRDLFSPRQLLCHGTSVEVFREMLEADRDAGRLDDIRQAAYGYLAFSLDTMLNYNSRMSVWMRTREVVANTFNRHDLAFCWSYAEMAPLVVGIGYDWTIKQTAKCIKELVALVHPSTETNAAPLFDQVAPKKSEGTHSPLPPVSITCKSADSLDHLSDGSIDAVVVDPPYYDNVMYAELSDFFYVWLKRTAGHVFPDLFRRQLTDKENEAVANPAKFSGEKGASALAGRDYQDRMAAIFSECRRVLKPSGIMTLMFTHKATGAWDALTTGLMEAGFAITASWPINTEAGGSLHIRDKAAANSTVFLACRPRSQNEMSSGSNGNDEFRYWEDVEPLVAGAVAKRVGEFQEAGIGGVDLFLAAFGPALEEFSRHWPLRRGTPRDRPESRSRQRKLHLDEWDPYSVTPEDALDVARREVKRWRLERLAALKADADLDNVTSFFVLAWDTFRAPVFPYDEALRLARAVGVDLDREIVGRLANKRSSDLMIWDSAHRAATGTLGPADGSRGMIDTLHHAAHIARSRSLAVAREILEHNGVGHEPRFLAALKAILEVLPMSPAITGVRLGTDAAAAGDDFEALYGLSRLAYHDNIGEPEQLKLWRSAAE
ncbi:MAG: DUF1156 domain-containing protein [Acidobacteriia bacterium]|nr:DUF1156 domain-containing protein [Terriglobia bacterium]MYG02774.1 DUF1156 domain-containing protein [Terriglobia bacterium]MYK11750.1 DUF1156 domain-containing protein [Terriglobia bacterium]